MCGRYVLTDGEQREKMQEFIEMCNRYAPEDERISVHFEDEVRPGDMAPGMICVGNTVQATAMRWGFAGKDGKLVINARSENVSERAMFRYLTESGRCVMPAAAYFEWRRGDGQKYKVASTTQKMMYLAGLCRLNTEGKREFVILTKPAFGIHSRIHNRMPVTLQTRESARSWLRGDISFNDILSGQDNALYAAPQGLEQMSMIFDD